MADTTYHYTVDIGNYKAFGLNQLRSVATVYRSTFNSRHCYA